MQTRMAQRPLLLTMGDPAGCGPQITAKLWQSRHELKLPVFAILAPENLFENTVPVQVIETPDEAGSVFSSALPVLSLKAKLPPIHPGHANPASAPAILESIERAVALCLSGKAHGLVTNPISKESLYTAGFTFPGHTEYLASLCQPNAVPDTLQDTAPLTPIMLLSTPRLKVALATIHMPLREVAAALSVEKLETIARITHGDLQNRFSIPAPRLAFCGLNPHAGENGTLGREEIEIINPAAARLREQGIDITNARPADTVFYEALQGRFDAVIAMTHDQGLIPIKTLDFWGGVNTTLGLPIIRTSPDHGTAFDAAKAGAARPDSLLAALRLAAELENPAPEPAR